MPERYIIYSEGSDEDAIREALKKISNLCNSFSHNKVILHIPGIGNLRGAIGNVLGINLIKKLKKLNNLRAPFLESQR